MTFSEASLPHTAEQPGPLAPRPYGHVDRVLGAVAAQLLDRFTNPSDPSEASPIRLWNCRNLGAAALETLDQDPATVIMGPEPGADAERQRRTWWRLRSENDSAYDRHLALVPYGLGDARPASWHIGWMAIDIDTSNVRLAQVCNIPISDGVRMGYDLSDSTMTTFFAVDTYGNQLPLAEIGDGVRGDGRHTNLPRF